MSERLADAELAGMALEDLVRALFEKRLTLTDADVQVLARRPDLADGVQRLNLLGSVVRVLPDHTLDIADTALATWLVQSLTRERFQKSRPVFLQIWGAAGAPSLSELARHGLDKMGERTARQAKELDAAVKANTIAWTPGCPYSDVSRPASALFNLNPQTAFDRLGRYFAPEIVATDTGAQLVAGVLNTLEMDRGPLPSDPRWVDAAAALVDHPRLKPYAKAVLNKAGPDAAKAALARAKARKATPAAEPERGAVAGRMPGGAEARYLHRYRAGEHEAVWKDLQLLGEGVRDPGVADQATAVARETMERVRRNVEKIVGRLRERGYKLKNPKKALAKPSTTVAKSIQAIEKAAGHPVPLSLRAFWEVVGSVDLSEGNRAYDEDEWFFELLGQEDPLVVIGAKEAKDQVGWVNADREGALPELREPFRIYISPGCGAKYDPDGMAGDDDPHMMALTGAAAADAVVQSHTGPNLPFVEYLRHYLKWGGFTGLQQPQDDPEWQGLSILTSDLEPF